MADADASGGTSLASTLGALTVAFLVVTPVSALLFGFNRTQAMLIGGFVSVVAVLSAVVTTRRSDEGSSEGIDG